MSVPRMLEYRPDPPYKKYIRYGILGVIVLAVLVVVLWFQFRFNPEKKTVGVFLGTVEAGHYQQAYHIWRAGPSYNYNDFLQDWGPKGYYGPVRSYNIVATHKPKNGSGVIVVVDISPFQSFPSDSDYEKDRQTKQVRLWVEMRDQTISYAP